MDALVAQTLMEQRKIKRNEQTKPMLMRRTIKIHKTNKVFIKETFMFFKSIILFLFLEACKTELQ